MKSQRRKSKILRKTMAISLAAAMTTGTILTVSAAPVQTTVSGDTVTRISNPDGTPGEIDGLISDREVGYGWSIAERGDYIYIGGWRNTVGAVIQHYLESALVSSGMMDSETVWKLVDIVTNGEVPYPANPNGGVLVKMKKSDPGNFEIITEMEDPFRNVVKYENDLYFSTYTGVTGNDAKIYKLDENDKLTEVYSTAQGASMRANCVYRDYLYFAGTWADEKKKDGEPTSLAVIKKHDNDDGWDKVADYRDFAYISEETDSSGNTVEVEGNYGNDTYVSASIASPFWDMTVFGDEIYATIPNLYGYVVFKGHPAKDGEKANEYGWVWTEVIGRDKNSPNNQGLAENKNGFEDGSSYAIGYQSVVGALGVFDGHLYTYDIDHTIGAELVGVQGMLALVSNPQNADLANYLKPLQTTLNHPQTLWRLNNENGKFEEMTVFTELTRDTANEYIWKHGVYNGEFYISTMDSKVIYNYLTRLTGGSFAEMTEEEQARQIAYIREFLSEKIQSQSGDSELQKQIDEIIRSAQEILPDQEQAEELKEKIESALSDFRNGGSYTDFQNAVEELIEEYVPSEEKRQEISEKINEVINNFDEKEQISGLVDKLVQIASKYFPTDEDKEKYREKLTNTYNELSSMNEWSDLLGVLSVYIGTRELLSPDDIALISDIGQMFNELNEIGQDDAEAIQSLVEKYQDIPERLKNTLEALSEKINSDPDALELSDEEREQLGNILESLAASAQTVIAKNWAEEIAALQSAAGKLSELYLETYMEISNIVKNDTQGFDIFKSSDGENWELVTNDGFGDKFNYGALRFLTTDEGMYITTANPFYGAQLYLLTNDKQAPDEKVITAETKTVDWERNSEKGADIKTNSDSTWVAVRKDGKHFGMDVENGVTVENGQVTFSCAFLSLLANGENALTLVFEDGTVDVVVNVTEGSQTDKPDSDNNKPGTDNPDKNDDPSQTPDANDPSENNGQGSGSENNNQNSGSENGQSADSGDNNGPQTGDGTASSSMLAAMAAISCAVAVIFRRKRKTDK